MEQYTEYAEYLEKRGHKMVEDVDPFEPMAVIYCRVSTFGQLKGGGLARQRESCVEFASRNGLRVGAIYNDAWSGKSSDRPAFNAMLSDLDNRFSRTKAVLIETSDRFARSMDAGDRLDKQLADRNVRVLYCDPLESEFSRKIDALLRDCIADFVRRYGENFRLADLLDVMQE